MNITKDMIGKKVLFTKIELGDFGLTSDPIYEGTIIRMSTDGKYVKIAMIEPEQGVKWFSTTEINIISLVDPTPRESKKSEEYL